MARNRFSRRDFLKSAAIGAGVLTVSGLERRMGLSAAAAGAASGTALPSFAPGAAPDMILAGGRVVTMDATDRVTQAVAIKGDRILQTGSDAVIRALRGPQTKIIELRGRTVTPGFVDAHNHMPVKGLVGTAYLDVNPPAVGTVAEMQAVVAQGCAEKGPDEWVIAQGYLSYDGVYPDKTMLDPVSPHNPVMLMNQGGHMGAANTYALGLAGINAMTPDPMFGVIERDAHGEPTGCLINHAAMDIVRKLWHDEILTPEVRHLSITGPQPGYLSRGLTTIGDVNVRGVDVMQAYFDAARGGDLAVRAYILNTIEYYKELEGRPDEIAAMLYEDDYLHFGGYKFLVDGAVEAAYMHEPTTGMAWDMPTWNPQPLKQAVSTLHELGYQCSFHCMGDAAVDMALDAIEFAMNAHPRSDPRHRLEHVLLSSTSALQRTRDLGVVVSTQPHLISFLGDKLISLWGEERAQRAIPTRTWLDLGVPLSVSSDCPTMPWWEPVPILAASVDRLAPSKRAIGPEQALTIEEAMRAYTMGGAYSCFEEDVKGSLEPGKFADLVVWRLDPYTAILEQQLGENPVDLTIVGGEIAFRRERRVYVPLV